MDLTGEMLEGRYKVTGPLGRGGMATVWLAEDQRLSRRVVVKVPDESLLRDPVFRERFSREVRSLVELEHPNVVRVLDAGRVGEVPYAVMQYLPGGSLKDVLDRTGARQSGETLLRWLGPIADALDSMHARNVIHRDIKPGNILFDADGRPYLSDFGIAKALDPTESELTRTGQSPGSPGYMPPEILEGRIGTAYDQYSLGAVVLKCLTGDPPPAFATPEKLAKAFAGRVTPAVAAVIRRAMALDPADRFPNCGAFARALMESFDTEAAPMVVPVGGGAASSSEATGTFAHGALPEPPPEPSPEPAGAPPAAVPRRRSKAPFFLVGAAGVVLLVLLIARGGSGPGIPPGGTPGATGPEAAGPGATGPGYAETLVVEQPGAPEVRTREASFSVVGRVEGGAAGAPVVVNGKPVPPGVDGRFSVVVELAEDANEISVRSAGGREQSFRIIRDSRPPDLAAPLLATPAVSSEKTYRIEGTVTDRSTPRLRINGVAVPLDTNGRFAFDLPLVNEGPNGATFEVEDAFGNAATAKASVVRDSHKPSVKMSALPRDVAGDSVLVQGEISEEGCTIEVNGVPAEQKGPYFWAKVPLSVGPNEIEVRARDRAGNEAMPIRGHVLRTPDLGRGYAYEELVLARVREFSLGKAFALADPPRNARGMLELVHRKTGLPFVVIPGGEFLMGSREKPEEGPPRRVAIRAFLLCRTECTQEAWLAGGGENRSRYRGRGMPVDGVSWTSALKWCRANGLRLPTEAEWEYACRAGTTTRFSCGDAENALQGFANVGDAWLKEHPKDVAPRDISKWQFSLGITDGYAGPAPSGHFAPNPWGLLDLHGNLWEHTMDCWQESYKGAPRDGSAFVERGSTQRACRGGCWAESAQYARSASRMAVAADAELDTHGFRPAEDLE